MPLLSLPNELLFEIIGYIAGQDHLDNGHANGSSQGLDLVGLPFADVLRVSQTCQALRAVGTIFIYSSITVDKRVGTLEALFKDYPYLALCARRVVAPLYPPLRWSWCPNVYITLPERDPLEKNYLVILGRVLGSCRNVCQLSIVNPVPRCRGWERVTFEPKLLELLAPESVDSAKVLTLERLGSDAVLAYFMRLLDHERCGLETVRILEDCMAWTRYSLNLGFLQERESIRKCLHLVTNTQRRLRSVRNFDFDAQLNFSTHTLKSDVGRFFAMVMLEVKVLRMATTIEFICGALPTYAELGSHLTELTLETPSQPPWPTEDSNIPIHFCETISKLSRNLTKFVSYSEFPMCEELFVASNWPKLLSMDIKCESWYRCREFSPRDFRARLEILTTARPQSVFDLEWRGIRLAGPPVSTGTTVRKGISYLAPLEVFEGTDSFLSKPTAATIGLQC